ncbi:DUF3293 domain-containing protein [Egicoccus sp. AB-alg2]|uniref:DUF3293 domain-containing protein n=1 Tax=Egicoccus sp. AB-alg2 TaxID=3242693 RepID=UPI00359EEB32
MADDVADDVADGMADDVDGLRRAYLDAVVEIDLDGRRLELTGAPRGTTRGRFPAGVGHVHVVTACNPRSEVLPAERNRMRNQALAAELAAAGLRSVPAVGRSPDGTWQEPSFAVLDADTPLLLDVADRHGQHAVYRWTPDELAVVWAGRQRGRVDAQGWVLRVIGGDERAR